MNILKEILTAYRSGERELPTYAELAAAASKCAINDVDLLDVLETGLGCAREVAADTHLKWAGYRPFQHEAVDADVAKIEKAILAIKRAADKSDLTACRNSERELPTYVELAEIHAHPPAQPNIEGLKARIADLGAALNESEVARGGHPAINIASISPKCKESTGGTARDPFLDDLKDIKAKLEAFADAEYVRGMGLNNRPECGGWEYKVGAGSFGQREYDAHQTMHRAFGSHYGIYAAINSVFGERVREESEVCPAINIASNPSECEESTKETAGDTLGLGTAYPLWCCTDQDKIQWTTKTIRSRLENGKSQPPDIKKALSLAVKVGDWIVVSAIGAVLAELEHKYGETK